MIRKATSADLESIAAVCRRSLSLDSDADQLPTLLWDRPESTADTQLVAVQDDRVVGSVLGSLGTGIGHIDLLAIDPDVQRTGIGTSLVAEIESAFRAAGATGSMVGGAVDRYAWPGVDVRYTPAFCLFARLGYKQAGEGTNMTVRLADLSFDIPAAERRLAAAGIEVRRLDPGERAEFDEWMQQWGASWPLEAGRSAAHTPPRCHVAVRDGAYLGFACHGANRDSWFGPMGTNEAARGQGVGGVLLARCLADQRDAGISEAEIGWVGPVSFYARTVNARIERVFWLLSKKL